jgi:hypothetical protein
VSSKLASGTLANGAAADGASGKAVSLATLEKSYEPASYLASGSDAVALLVLAHQTQMHNLITLTNYKARIALHAAGVSSEGEQLPDAARQQFERPAEQLLRYLLFVNEAQLSGEPGESSFAREFSARGPRDSKGRSLRDFDLHTRIFKYPCSYLIYSDAFDALPEASRSYVYHRLLQVLTGQDGDPDFDSLSADSRQAILEILLETKPKLPQEWQDYARSHDLLNASQRGK